MKHTGRSAVATVLLVIGLFLASDTPTTSPGSSEGSLILLILLVSFVTTTLEFNRRFASDRRNR